MNYQESQDYLNNLSQFGIQLGLNNISLLLDKIKSPQQRLKLIIHVTGTNGKGSTIAFLNSILSEAGFKVGVYTSPHLISFTERIAINHTPILEEEVAEGLTYIRENIPEGLNLTYFEVTTALAFHYFAQKKVDLTLLEVGLGGRLDATNVVNSQISVITNIDYDHTDWLGDSLAKIAFEKAGIIKKNSEVITGVASGEALSVIERRALEMKSSLYLVNKDIKYRVEKSNTIWGEDFKYQNLELGLMGKHQTANAALALMAVELLRKKGVNISEEEIKRGLKKAKWLGRAQVISENPTILLDGAHNPGGAKALRELIEERYFQRPRIMIIGILKDKDVSGIIKELLGKDELVQVILCEPDCERALFTSEIRKEVLKYISEENVQEIKEIKKALNLAKDKATKDHLICVTGSLYTVAEVLNQVRESK